MRRFFALSLILLLVMVFSVGDVFAKKEKPDRALKINAVARLNQSGDITGVVACTDGSSAHVPVYLAGESFIAITDAGGNFRFLNVPEKTEGYELYIVADPTAGPALLGTVVPVRKQIKSYTTEFINIECLPAPQEQ